MLNRCAHSAYRIFILMLGMGVTIAPDVVSLSAAPVPATATAAATEPVTELQRLAAEIASNDADRIKAAIPQIRKFIEKNKVSCASVGDGVRLLLKARAYDGIDEIASEVAIANPADCALLLKARVAAFLGLKKKEDALAAAKIYYNYVPLDQSMDAINTLTVALMAARPDEKSLISRFRNEQFVRVEPQTRAPLAKAEDESAGLALASISIMDSIKIEGKAFQDAADQVKLDTRESYTRKGNLLLMAGNGKAAHEAFEHAKALTEGKELDDANANIARAIRTENCCVGPAKAYLLEMREKPAH